MKEAARKKMAAVDQDGLLSNLEQLDLLWAGIVWHKAQEQLSSRKAAGNLVQSGSADCIVCISPS